VTHYAVISCPRTADKSPPQLATFVFTSQLSLDTYVLSHRG